MKVERSRAVLITACISALAWLPLSRGAGPDGEGDTHAPRHGGSGARASNEGDSARPWAWNSPFGPDGPWALQTLEEVGPHIIASDAPEEFATVTVAEHRLRRTGPTGTAAAAGVETVIYRNDTDPVAFIYRPGAGQRMADDLSTFGTPSCRVSSYELTVAGLDQSGDPNYDVTVSLWDGDPCNPGSSMLSQGEFAGLPNDGSTMFTLEVTLPEPVSASGTLWMAATFSIDDAGWIVAAEAETGFTADWFSEDDETNGCALFSFQDGTPYAGFWATVRCTEDDERIAACCTDSSCQITTESDCAAQRGYFVDGVASCEFGNPCLEGVCCTDTPACVEDDGGGGRMDEELCGILGGQYVGGAFCDASDPCRRFRIPMGFEIIDVSQGDFQYGWPSLNDCGELVFNVRLGSSFAQSEIFLYEDGPIRQITENSDRDVFPQINDVATVMWSRGPGDDGIDRVVHWADGKESVLAMAPEPESSTALQLVLDTINDLDYAVMHFVDQSQCPRPFDLAIHDGEKLDFLAKDGLNHQSADLNNLGEVAWTRKIIPSCEFTQDWTSTILLYSGGKILELPSSRTQPNGATINDLGTVAWGDFDLLEVWENGETTILTDGHLPSINNAGDIAYQMFPHDRHERWELWLYRDGGFHLLSNPEDPEDNRRADINEAGEVAWAWHAYESGLTPSGIRYMRRIRNGDVNFDGVVDENDVVAMPACYTGPGDTDRLCECRFFDLDHDRDVDHDDLDLLLRSYTGPLEDCNDNLILDFEELLDGTLTDCHRNARPDNCDLADGTSTDADGDGLPDECCSPAAPLAGDTLGAKNRFLSIQTAGAPNQTPGVPISPETAYAPPQAIRVTPTDLPAPFDAFTGQSLWVGPPREACENAGQGLTADPDDCGNAGGAARTFTTASLQCAPHYADWDAIGPVYVYHELIIPGGVYQVDVINESCAATTASNFSPALPVPTARWGDLTTQCGPDGCDPPDDVIGVQDVLGRLDKFSNLPGAPIKPRADLSPATVDGRVDVVDIVHTLNAFAGVTYPFPPPPSPCP